MKGWAFVGSKFCRGSNENVVNQLSIKEILLYCL